MTTEHATFPPNTPVQGGTEADSLEAQVIATWAARQRSKGAVEWITKSEDGPQEFLWSKQREICESVEQNRFTAVRACHGPGKSYVASRIAAWWLMTKPDPFVVTSAPTSAQVEAILWREIRRVHRKIKDKVGKPRAGYITQGKIPEWKVNDELVAFGRKPADYVDPDKAGSAFQGIHALHVLVILDEGSGIPKWLFDAGESLVTNEKSRLLVIGNPQDPQSHFAKVCQPGSGYHNIKIAASDTPAFTGEEVPEEVAQVLTSQLWVQERRQRWGEESPLYVAKVLAEFPDISEDALITPAMLNLAYINDRRVQAGQQKGYAALDVARYGSDKSTLYRNRAGMIRKVQQYTKLDTMSLVGRVRRHMDEAMFGVPTHVDVAGGLGAGPYDRLRELGYSVVPFNGGERPVNTDKYRNRRAETYWEFREALEQGLIDLDEMDEDLAAELLEIKFFYTSSGKIQIEPKEEIKKRLGVSTDHADAATMCLQQTGDWMRVLGPGTERGLDRPPDDNPDTNPAAGLLEAIL